MIKSGLEAFAKKGEKSLLKNMFREADDSSDDSMSDCESNSDEIAAVSSDALNSDTESAGYRRNIIASNDRGKVADNADAFHPTNMNDKHSSNISHLESGSIQNLVIAESTEITDLGKTIEVYKSSSDLFQILLQQEKRKGIAHQLWPAATFLSRYLESHITRLSPSAPEKTNILELGAGIGLCGLVCSALKFKKVILTDLPVAIDLLNSNIKLNSTTVQDNLENSVKNVINDHYGARREDLDVNSNDIESITSKELIDVSHINDFHDNIHSTSCNIISAIEASVLSWGCQTELVEVMRQFEKGPLLVIAADCVYWEILFKPLYDTVKDLVTNFNAEIIISHVRRWKKDEKFFKMCRKTLIVELLEESIEHVPAEHTGVLTREIKRIYRIKATQ